jgi:hypothetical protein
MPAAGEPDLSLRRVQRDSAIIAVATAAAALVIQGGRPEGALGVLAGAAIMGFSYSAIKGGVTAMLERAAAASRPDTGERAPKARVAWLLARFIGRYLAAGLVAWVVLVPLRAHPLGLFAGVTVPVVAIGVEAVRLVRGKGPPGKRPSTGPSGVDDSSRMKR